MATGFVSGIRRRNCIQFFGSVNLFDGKVEHKFIGSYPSEEFMPRDFLEKIHRVADPQTLFVEHQLSL